MGLQIKDILEYEEVDLNYLSGKKIGIDSMNMLYQFVSSIRQPDGSLLMDSQGNVTSHLKGLFNRCVYFKKNNIKPVFIFDGEPPKLKEKELENRKKKKIEANKKYQEAKELDLVEDAKKYSVAATKVDSHMIEESKKLVELFGFPIIQAPSEGEAQAAYLANKKKVFATSSQDFDSLLFGSPFLLRNFSVSQKRKVQGSSMYREVSIELYDLEKNLDKLGINKEELIIVAILTGTDFNIGGIKGIGPKKAMKLIKEYKNRWDELFESLEWSSYFDYNWREVFDTINKMPVDENYNLEFKNIQKNEIKNFLIEKDFEETVIERSLNQIKNHKTLENYF